MLENILTFVLWFTSSSPGRFGGMIIFLFWNVTGKNKDEFSIKKRRLCNKFCKDAKGWQFVTFWLRYQQRREDSKRKRSQKFDYTVWEKFEKNWLLLFLFFHKSLHPHPTLNTAGKRRWSVKSVFKLHNWII